MLLSYDFLFRPTSSLFIASSGLWCGSFIRLLWFYVWLYISINYKYNILVCEDFPLAGEGYITIRVIEILNCFLMALICGALIYDLLTKMSSCQM